ncbi:MAG: GGDEF domain-containing protein [Planctomycetota bacterium]
MTNDALESVLRNPRLPSLPSVALQILELTRDETVEMKAVADVVRYDQGLSAKVLRTVNSSFYGLSKPCATIQQALVYLGLNTVKSVVLGFSLVESMDGGDETTIDFDYITYWRRSIYAAVAARELAQYVPDVDADEAFLAALMQDVGMIVLFRVFDDEYLQCLDINTSDGHRELLVKEQQYFEMTHAEVGAAMAQKWNLPESLQSAICHHHDHRRAPLAHQSFVRVIELAGQAAEALKVVMPPDAINTYLESASEWIGLAHVDARELLGTIATSADELGALFDVKTGAMPDVQAIMSSADEFLLAHQMKLEREREMLAESNEALKSQSVTDPLTGAANRKCFDQEFTRLFESAHTGSTCLSIVFCDADRFKLVNDTYGHQAGDAVLMELARRLIEVVGDTGTVCRYGGEEFAILLPDMNRTEATRCAEAMRGAIEGEPISIGAGMGDASTIPVTVSLGVASLEPAYRHIISRPDLLLRVADQAVYASKNAGRNCVRVFRPKVAA